MKVGKVFQTLRSVGLCTHCTFAQEFALFFRIPPFLAAIPALLLNKEATDVACLTLLPSPSIPSAVREGTKPTHPPTLSPSQSDPFFLPVPPLSPQNPLPSPQPTPSFPSPNADFAALPEGPFSAPLSGVLAASPSSGEKCALCGRTGGLLRTNEQHLGEGGDGKRAAQSHFRGKGSRESKDGKAILRKEDLISYPFSLFFCCKKMV